MGKRIRKQILMVDGSGKRMIGKTCTFRNQREYEGYMKRVLADDRVVRVLERAI